jgi:hypothetical protein
MRAQAVWGDLLDWVGARNRKTLIVAGNLECASEAAGLVPCSVNVFYTLYIYPNFGVVFFGNLNNKSKPASCVGRRGLGVHGWGVARGRGGGGWGEKGVGRAWRLKRGQRAGRAGMAVPRSSPEFRV